MSSAECNEPLSLDSMRADIARIIDVDISEVGKDDNLIDLGLDSMRMMSLILKWSQQGFPFEFADLAEYTTVGEWWETIERLKGETS